MASQSAVNLDTVMIQVESNAGKASTNIGKLAKQLETLRSSVKGGFNNINKLANSLAALNQATKGLSTTAKNLKALDEVTKSLTQLKDIKSPTGLVKAVESLQKLPEVINKMDSKTFENLARVSNELAQSLTPLADKMQQIADGYSAFSKIQNTFGKSASTVTRNSDKMRNVLGRVVNVLRTGVKNVYTFTKSLKQGFNKSILKQMESMKSKIKQIGLSLLGTRTIFTMTRKAVSEYQAFDQTLQKFSQNVWRAFGAQLAPVIEYVMDLFKQFVRVIYSAVYALTGIDLIARANSRAMASWGKNAEDTLGNLQKFDDLNVVEFDKGNGADNELINMDKIDLSPIQKIIDWVKEMRKEIQDALNTGRWENVGIVFANGINDGIKFMLDNFNAIENKLKSIAENFAEFLNGAIKKVRWDDIGEFITRSLTLIPNTISSFLKKIEWDGLGQGITDFFKKFSWADKIKADTQAWVDFVTGLQTALLTADWSIIGTALSDTLVAWTAKVPSILREIKWEELGIKLGEALRQIKWGEIFKNIIDGIGELFTGLFEGLSGILEGAFNLDAGAIDSKMLMEAAGAIAVLVLAITALVKLNSGSKNPAKQLKDIGSGMSSLLSGLGKAAGIIAVLGGMALVLQSLSDVLKSFGETGLTAGQGVGLIVGLFGSLAASMLVFQLAFNAMDWTAIAAGLVVFAGLSATFATLSMLFESISETGFTAGETMGVLAVVMGSVIALIAAMTIAAMALQNPLAMAGVAVVVAAIAAVMFTLKETIPTILDACGKFISQIAPYIIQLVTVIGVLINEIIKSLGTTLPPIITSIGNMFNRIFNGVAVIISTVGDVIVRVMNTAANNVTVVLTTILRFINELGPAINNFVNNAIVAVTKLINFIVSAVEYLLNTAIIKPINKLINKINNNAIAEKLGWNISTLGTVSVDRFAPKLETGTNEIPYEGIYHLHPGEAVVPKKYNPALGNGGSEEMNQKLDTLISIMDNMQFTNVVNIGNKKVYEGQQAYNKMQQNKYGTVNLY